VGYRCRICSMPLLDESRKRFLAKFFVVGACAPAVWVSAIYALRDLPVSSGLSEVFGWVLYSVYFVTFPTQVIFLDAEHLPEILFSLVIAAPMNGAWYVFVAILFWLLLTTCAAYPVWLQLWSTVHPPGRSRRQRTFRMTNREGYSQPVGRT
jgi:hypothetical protein